MMNSDGTNSKRKGWFAQRDLKQKIEAVPCFDAGRGAGTRYVKLQLRVDRDRKRKRRSDLDTSAK